MKNHDVNWHPVSKKPKDHGTFLIWSYKLGVRLTSVHPSWWNTKNYPEVQRVTLFARIVGNEGRKEIRRLTHSGDASQ